MKVRTQHVSNSSSTSFIIAGFDKQDVIMPKHLSRYIYNEFADAGDERCQVSTYTMDEMVGVVLQEGTVIDYASIDKQKVLDVLKLVNIKVKDNAPFIIKFEYNEC